MDNDRPVAYSAFFAGLGVCPGMIEVEIKLAIGPAEAEVRRLLQLGARVVSSRSFEDNILLDVSVGELRARGAMLRLRLYADTATLTYKEPAAGPEGFKTRREIEGSVQEPASLLRILEAAGLQRRWRYVKFRTVLKRGEVTIGVDETPVGNFLELEGPAPAIDDLASLLGRAPSDYSTATYRELYERWCAERSLQPADMLFPGGPAA